MSIFVYNNHNITNPQALVDSLADEGVLDYNFTMNGMLEIDTSDGTQSQCDDAVTNAADNGLIDAKAKRRDQYDARSTELTLIGAESWISGVFVPCSLDDYQSAEIAKFAFEHSL